MHSGRESYGVILRELGKFWADELTGDNLDEYFDQKRSEGYAVATVMN